MTDIVQLGGHKITHKSIKGILAETGLSWPVVKAPLYVNVQDRAVPVGYSAYIANDAVIAANVQSTQEPIQNSEALNLFQNIINTLGGELVGAGSLRGDQIVWFMGRIPIEFSLKRNGKDTVVAHLLFTNCHIPGKTPTMALLPIRVESFTSLSSRLDNIDYSRPQKAKAEIEAEMNNIANSCRLLESVTYTTNELTTYLTEVFPLTGSGKGRWDISIPARKVLQNVNEFPGAHLGAGTWWQAYVAVCYAIDYLLGQKTDTRLDSAWYGANYKRKMVAFNAAIRHAKK